MITESKRWLRYCYTDQKIDLRRSELHTADAARTRWGNGIPLAAESTNELLRIEMGVRLRLVAYPAVQEWAVYQGLARSRDTHCSLLVTLPDQRGQQQDIPAKREKKKTCFEEKFGEKYLATCIEKMNGELS